MISIDFLNNQQFNNYKSVGIILQTITVSGSALINFAKHKMCFKNKMTKVNKEVDNLNSLRLLYQPWDSEFHN